MTISTPSPSSGALRVSVKVCFAIVAFLIICWYDQTHSHIYSDGRYLFARDTNREVSYSFKIHTLVYRGTFTFQIRQDFKLIRSFALIGKLRGESHGGCVANST